MNKYANIYTHAIHDGEPNWPNPIQTPAGPAFNPNPDIVREYLRLQGWRRISSIATPPEGFRVTEYIIIEDGSETCHLIIGATVNIAEEQAAQEAARQAEELAHKEALALDAGDALVAKTLVAVINLRLAADKKITKAECAAEARKQLGLT